MTLQELLTGVLQQLDRGTDAQTVEVWRDKLCAFINDAIVDLAGELALRRTDELAISDGSLDLSQLPRGCIKVCALRIGGRRWPFYYGAGNQLLSVPGAPEGMAQITYRYVPQRLSADTDVPDLPEWTHGYLVLYAVGRERAGGDAASLSAARACFEIYNAAKRQLKPHSGESDAYAFENRY